MARQIKSVNVKRIARISKIRDERNDENYSRTEIINFLTNKKKQLISSSINFFPSSIMKKKSSKAFLAFSLRFLF